MLPLKLFISSTRLGLWNVNQYAKVEFLPLFRSIYSKYMSHLTLPNDVNQGFHNGLFVSKLREGNFNSVWIDYVLEATENKTLKGADGIIGLTLKGNALARWFLARPVTAKYSMNFMLMFADARQRHRVIILIHMQQGRGLIKMGKKESNV